MASRTTKPAGTDPSTEELDRIYGAPPDGFTRARDQVASELGKAGRKAAAATVRALRRPTRSAWAVDQLARRFPDRLEELLRIGDELARAQQQALRGGGGDSLRKATAREREAVGLLTEAASAILEAHGAVPRELVSRVRATLHALPTAGEEDRSRIRQGTLERDLEPAPFGRLEEGAGKLGPRPPPPRPAPAREAREPVQVQKAKEAAGAKEAARVAAARAREQQQRDAERSRSIERATAEVRQHEAQVERAAKALDAAKESAAAAAGKVQQARLAVETAEGKLSRARRNLELVSRGR